MPTSAEFNSAIKYLESLQLKSYNLSDICRNYRELDNHSNEHSIIINEGDILIKEINSNLTRIGVNKFRTTDNSSYYGVKTDDNATFISVVMNETRNMLSGAALDSQFPNKYKILSISYAIDNCLNYIRYLEKNQKQKEEEIYKEEQRLKIQAEKIAKERIEEEIKRKNKEYALTSDTPKVIIAYKKNNIDYLREFIKTYTLDDYSLKNTATRTLCANIILKELNISIK